MSSIRNWVVALALAAVSPALAQTTKPTGAPIVFFDIAGPDLKGQSKFYSQVFGWTPGPTGDLEVATVGGTPGSPALSGFLRTDPPATVIYLGVDDIDATLAKIKAAGGAVVFPRHVVPRVVVIAMFKDPAGNQLGLVELAGGKPKVP